MKSSQIRVLHAGLGPIGCAVLRVVTERAGLMVVGAVDIDPSKVGRDIGEIAGLGKLLRLKVRDDLGPALKALKPDVIVTQDVFVYDILGEDANGMLLGKHRSTGITKPQFTERARYFNEEANLVEALEKANTEQHEILGR